MLRVCLVQAFERFDAFRQLGTGAFEAGIEFLATDDTVAVSIDQTVDGSLRLLDLFDQ